MFRIRYCFALSKPFLPTVRQISFLPYFKGKAKIIKEKTSIIEEYENRIKRIKLLHGIDEERRRNELVSMKLELERKISSLELEKQEEKSRLELEKQEEKSRLEREIDKEKADRHLEQVKTGHLILNYLKLQGALHLRGVFEQWELFSLGNFEGNRKSRWSKYLNENQDVFKTFQSFYPNPSEININHVVVEVTSFYKWLSERIHNANALGDYIEWQRDSLTHVQNKIAEYMCKKMNLEYRIIESDKD